MKLRQFCNPLIFNINFHVIWRRDRSVGERRTGFLRFLLNLNIFLLF